MVKWTAVWLWMAATATLGCDDGDGGKQTTTDAAGSADAAASDDATASDDAGTDMGPPAAPGPEVFADRVDLTDFAADLEFIAQPRTPDSPHWQAVQDRCAEVFTASGFTVERHNYGSGVNVIGVRPGTTTPDEWVVISGHYDHIEACAGADDNASGAAGTLAAARALGNAAFERTLVVACWDEEEWGLVGSRAWTERAKRQNAQIKASYVFDAMGYFSDEPNSQSFPAGFELIFAEAGRMVADRDGRGDFITAIADDVEPSALADFQAGAQRVDLPVVPVVLNAAYRGDASLGDLRRSDHAEFWKQGWHSMQLTDSANFRNPAYHCTLAEDDIASVDMERTLKVVQATAFAAARQARPAVGTGMGAALDTTTDPMPPVAACDLYAQDCPPGDKCFFTGSGSAFQVQCVPAGPTGPGEVCTRDAMGDNCGPGHYCTFFDQPFADPQVRVCTPLCQTDNDCAAGKVCVEAERPHHVGFCATACDPIDPAACGAGQACLDRNSAQPGTRTGACHPSAPRTQMRGQPCTSSDLCAPGLYCLSGTDTPATCTPWCANDADCGANSRCLTRGIPDRGVCVPS